MRHRYFPLATSLVILYAGICGALLWVFVKDLPPTPAVDVLGNAQQLAPARETYRGCLADGGIPYIDDDGLFILCYSRGQEGVTVTYAKMRPYDHETHEPVP